MDCLDFCFGFLLHWADIGKVCGEWCDSDSFLPSIHSSFLPFPAHSLLSLFGAQTLQALRLRDLAVYGSNDFTLEAARQDPGQTRFLPRSPTRPG